MTESIARWCHGLSSLPGYVVPLHPATVCGKKLKKKVSVAQRRKRLRRVV